MQADLELAIRKFVTDNFLFHGDAGSLSGDASLTGSGLLDSSGILELVAFLEASFPLIVTDEEMTPTNLDSIDRIAAYVRRKIHHMQHAADSPDRRTEGRRDGAVLESGGKR